MMTSYSPVVSITLEKLLPGIALGKAATITVRDVCLDSRQLKAGDAFIALVGNKVDGRDYIAKAIEVGASAVLVEADKNWQGIDWLGNVPIIAIEKLSAQVSAIAARFFDEPSKKNRLIGITGTNGKTTCSLLAAQLLARLQGKSAVVGTLGYGLLDTTALAPIAQQLTLFRSTGLTTPDPIALQRILAELVSEGATSVVFEVSSHSLQQKRVADVQIHTAIFTNLTQDHLDYHGDFASYGNAKAQLLQAPGLHIAIMNLDDNWAKGLSNKAPVGVDVLTYSVNPSDGNRADIYASNIELHALGVNAHIVTPWGEADIQSPLLGAFNLSNLLAVIAAVAVQGFNLEEIVALLAELQPAPGRMQQVVVDQAAQQIQVIVDYAHTPDALENTLNAIHQHQAGNIWTVFGCGGERDKTKRPQMGTIAERLSDYVIVTNDNPRSEDPSAIAGEILRGMNRPSGCLVIADRAQAIDFAVQQAKAGDIVLIAGKGHEDYQIFAHQTLPFSDTKQARIALQKRITKYENDKSSTGATS
jgi:UDP-N-acetylmuramoyl-L-alanyl-D-glutamate--2,6-diaminopimelate ligase